MKTLSLLISLFCLSTAASAKHELQLWPESPYLLAGIEFQNAQSNKGVTTFCNGDRSETGRIVIGQKFLQKEQFAMEWQINHMSCVWQADWHNYNAVGVYGKLYFW